MKGTARNPRGIDETNLSTEQPATQTHPRLPRPHGHARGARRPETATSQGAQASNSEHSNEATSLAAPLQRFPKASRIRRRTDFLRLQRVGRRQAKGRFVVITEVKRNGLSRLGITTSRKVGGAVVRNRIKRRVREFFRTHRQLIRPAQDILVIARPSAAGLSYAEIAWELGQALNLHVSH